jgi:hypothetical protein
MRRPHNKFIDLGGGGGEQEPGAAESLSPEEAEIVRQLSVSKDVRKLKAFSMGMASSGEVA